MDFADGVINVSFDWESICRSLKVAMAAPASFNKKEKYYVNESGFKNS